MNEASRAIEEIRRAELEAAQHVEEARTKASEMKANASAEGLSLVAEGRRRGRDVARERHEAAIRDATEAAEAIRAVTGLDRDTLKEAAGESKDLLVAEMVRAVLAPPSEPGK